MTRLMIFIFAYFQSVSAMRSVQYGSVTSRFATDCEMICVHGNIQREFSQLRVFSVFSLTVLCKYEVSRKALSSIIYSL